LNHPERNPGGLLVVRANNIKVDKELIDAITFYKPLFDMRDSKKVKAVLHENGGGLTITEPSVPTYLVKEVVEIHLLEGDKDCVPTQQAHSIAATNIQTKEARQDKQVHLMFPAGIICKLDHFNGKKNRKLKNNFRMIETIVEKRKSPDKDRVQLTPFIVWKLTIDGEARHLEQQASDDSDDDWDAASKRMSSMQVSSSTAP